MPKVTIFILKLGLNIWVIIWFTPYPIAATIVAHTGAERPFKTMNFFAFILLKPNRSEMGIRRP